MSWFSNIVHKFGHILKHIGAILADTVAIGFGVPPGVTTGIAELLMHAHAGNPHAKEKLRLAIQDPHQRALYAAVDQHLRSHPDFQTFIAHANHGGGTPPTEGIRSSPMPAYAWQHTVAHPQTPFRAGLVTHSSWPEASAGYRGGRGHGHHGHHHHGHHHGAHRAEVLAAEQAEASAGYRGMRGRHHPHHHHQRAIAAREAEAFQQQADAEAAANASTGYGYGPQPYGPHRHHHHHHHHPGLPPGTVQEGWQQPPAPPPWQPPSTLQVAQGQGAPDASAGYLYGRTYGTGYLYGRNYGGPHHFRHHYYPGPVEGPYAGYTYHFDWHKPSTSTGYVPHPHYGGDWSHGLYGHGGHMPYGPLGPGADRILADEQYAERVYPPVDTEPEWFRSRRARWGTPGV